MLKFNATSVSQRTSQYLLFPYVISIFSLFSFIINKRNFKFFSRIGDVWSRYIFEYIYLMSCALKHFKEQKCNKGLTICIFISKSFSSNFESCNLHPYCFKNITTTNNIWFSIFSFSAILILKDFARSFTSSSG